MQRKPNIVDRLAAVLPGYSNYAARESQRLIDEKLRDRICAALRDCEKLIEGRMDELLMHRKVDPALTMDRRRKRLNTLAGAIKFAPSGTSGWLSDQQVGTPELANVLERDLDLLEIVDELAQRVADIDDADLDRWIARIDRAVHDRNHYLQEFK